ncbi:amino acid ABC transporter permease [Salsipaludibacter albus]|uniref:amino acid ABC transporter permease n=1 Tax=Salsipaludibacter albus TaxID=2849650 RepID=UPI001EE45FE6|nr:amino acid ABC transporter permease [Salsipaludibacter albus]MBY5162986.1 amino acid ABC transporter permease [Salsipaludibacter albus]
MSSVLIEELGPRGKARVRVATIISILVGIVLLALVVWKLGTAGQLTWAKWEPFTVWANLEFLLGGLVNTIKAALAAMVFSIIIGFFFALGRLSRNAVVRGLCVAYVEFFRSIPLLLAIFMGFFGLLAAGLDVGAFTSLVVALVAYNSAVLSEIFRAGIKSLDKGQTEAAQAIGMRYWPMMRIVILPQAVRRMVPAIVAQLATLSKDVSLGFVIGYEEVVRRGQGFPGFSDAGNFQAYVVVGVVYFILVWMLARLARYLELRQRTSSIGTGAAAIDGAGLEDIAALSEEADAAEVEAAAARGEDPDRVVDSQTRARGAAEEQGTKLNEARKGDRDRRRGRD